MIDTFLFHLFSAQLLNLDTGNNAIGKSLNSKFLREELKIPLPPLDIQQKIVQECETVDLVASSKRQQVEIMHQKINEIIKNIKSNAGSHPFPDRATPGSETFSIMFTASHQLHPPGKGVVLQVPTLAWK